MKTETLTVLVKFYASKEQLSQKPTIKERQPSQLVAQGQLGKLMSKTSSSNGLWET